MQFIKQTWMKHFGEAKQFGATTLRLAFAIMFIFVGVKKLRMGYGGFAEALVSNPDSLMAQEVPHILLYIYGYLLPAAELIAGFLLLFNKYTKLAYGMIALMYLSFILGQEYEGNTSKIGTEYFPALLALVLAYFLQFEYKKSSS